MTKPTTIQFKLNCDCGAEAQFDVPLDPVDDTIDMHALWKATEETAECCGWEVNPEAARGYRLKELATLGDPRVVCEDCRALRDGTPDVDPEDIPEEFRMVTPEQNRQAEIRELVAKLAELTGLLPTMTPEESSLVTAITKSFDRDHH